MSKVQTISARIQHKHDIEANWQKATNFVPLAGEIIIYDPDIDSGGTYHFERFKIGDGSTPVNDLMFYRANSSDWNQNDGAQLDFIANKPAVKQGVTITKGANTCVIINSANNTAHGDCSTAEGSGTVASGFHCHAEGSRTEATGDQAHAEGFGTIASGKRSHSEGLNTIAAGNAQHVQGKNNIADVDAEGNALSTYAHIVGNGLTPTKRSNAHTLDWDGNAWYQGDIYVGGTSQTDGIKVATLNDISRYNQITMIDKENGFDYILEFHSGKLASYCACSSIAVTTLPDKTEYASGEDFEPAGMVITATCQDGSTREITNYSCTILDNIVTISYIEGNTTYTTELNVTITS
jgi:hypothetical protein